MIHFNFALKGCRGTVLCAFVGAGIRRFIGDVCVGQGSFGIDFHLFGKLFDQGFLCSSIWLVCEEIAASKKGSIREVLESMISSSLTN